MKFIISRNISINFTKFFTSLECTTKANCKSNFIFINFRKSLQTCQAASGRIFFNLNVCLKKNENTFLLSGNITSECKWLNANEFHQTIPKRKPFENENSTKTVEILKIVTFFQKETKIVLFSCHSIAVFNDNIFYFLLFIVGCPHHLIFLSIKKFSSGFRFT